MKKEKSPKPKYGMASNVWFMCKLAWTSGEKKVLVLCILAALLSVASNLVNLCVTPMILGAVERHASVAQLLLTIAGFVLAMVLVSGASAYVNSNTLFGRITVRSEVIALLCAKSATTSYSNLGDERFEKLQEKAYLSTNNNHEATEAIWKTLTELTENLLGFAIYCALLTGLQPLLIPVILVTAWISYGIGNATNGYEYRHREEVAGYERQLVYLNRLAGQTPAGKDIRIFGLRPWLEELYGKAIVSYMAFHGRAQGVYIWAGIADLCLTFLRNAAVYAYLIGIFLRDGLTVAEFLLYFAVAGGFTGWVTGILGGFNTLHKQSLDLSTVREFLTYEEPFLLTGGEPICGEVGKSYEIRLENVSFRYPGAEKDTLTEISLTLHPGEKLAVVGLNGAGKTTLVKLLCGFLDPTKGRVLLNGTDIRALNRTGYYTLFAAVFQDFSLLAGTVAQNIAQRDAGIDMERVRKCAQMAGLQGKIESLPQGYETNLNREVYEDGAMLSGGETQRLMLARALYKENAPFVLLDEPTAALDPLAEEDMYRKYHEMTQGRSSIYISHRLASTRFCDRILLIADARVAEEGTHEELLRSGGRYAELFAVQSKYYREGEAGHGEE